MCYDVGYVHFLRFLFTVCSSTETRNKDIHTLGFSLKQPDSEELLTEEELFRGFSNEFRSDGSQNMVLLVVQL